MTRLQLQYAAQAIASADLDHAMQAVTSSGNTETAHIVYDLLSIEHAVHWMHACLGYPAAATSIKACRTKKFVGSLSPTKSISKILP